MENFNTHALKVVFGFMLVFAFLFLLVLGAMKIDEKEKDRVHGWVEKQALENCKELERVCLFDWRLTVEKCHFEFLKCRKLKLDYVNENYGDAL